MSKRSASDISEVKDLASATESPSSQAGSLDKRYKRRKQTLLTDQPTDNQLKRVGILDAHVKGLVYVNHFLCAEKQRTLLHWLDAQPWSSALRRRTQHYGCQYNYQSKTVTKEAIQPLPAPLRELAAELQAFFLPDVCTSQCSSTPTYFDQVIVNEYLVGQGIAAHIDQPQAFSDHIVTVSLGSGACMRFARGGCVPHEQYLRIGSAALLSDEARYVWTHSIPARKTDRVHEGQKAVPRGRRVSVTFRKVQYA